ncbi:MAG: polyprenyl synthetase family protein [Caldithrix sp.]|nr:polyprenyl synthetase family protein [Caldithrix sp.]
MDHSLAEIKKPFAQEWEAYQKTFKTIMSSDIKLVDTVVKYIVRYKGKGLRPLLALMSGKLVGKINENTYIVASILEMLHTATLIHDDVVDEAHIRRGFPSINAVWKNKISVLMGDYLLSKCLIGATKTNKLSIMQILADASKRLSKGELKQIEEARKLKITEKSYFDIISNKTAALIGAAAELGAITTSDNEQDHKNLRMFGENLGIAFQIKDDLLDYYGQKAIIGKPVGKDIKDKKITLPMIHAFKNASDREIRKIKRLIKRGANSKEIKYIIDFVEQNDGIQYANQKKIEYADKARGALESYSMNEAKQAIFQFVDYTVERKQ